MGTLAGAADGVWRKVCLAGHVGAGGVAGYWADCGRGRDLSVLERGRDGTFGLEDCFSGYLSPSDDLVLIKAIFGSYVKSRLYGMLLWLLADLLGSMGLAMTLLAHGQVSYDHYHALNRELSPHHNYQVKLHFLCKNTRLFI